MPRSSVEQLGIARRRTLPGCSTFAQVRARRGTTTPRARMPSAAIASTSCSGGVDRVLRAGDHERRRARSAPSRSRTSQRGERLAAARVALAGSTASSSSGSVCASVLARNGGREPAVERPRRRAAPFPRRRSGRPLEPRSSRRQKLRPTCSRAPAARARSGGIASEPHPDQCRRARGRTNETRSLLHAGRAPRLATLRDASTGLRAQASRRGPDGRSAARGSGRRTRRAAAPTCVSSSPSEFASTSSGASSGRRGGGASFTMLLRVECERPVDERARRAEVARRVERGLDLVRALSRSREDVSQRRARERVALDPEREDGPLGEHRLVQVRAHPLRVDLEPVERSATAAAAPPVSASARESASHSACQAPSARSCSCSPPASTRGAACTRRAQATRERRPDGVALVRHRRRAAAARRARTSPTSVCASRTTSSADLRAARRPRSPSAAPSSRDRQRGRVCHGSGGSASPSSLREEAQHLGPVARRAPRACRRRRRAARGADASSRPSRASSRRDEPAGRLAARRSSAPPAGAASARPSRVAGAAARARAARRGAVELARRSARAPAARRASPRVSTMSWLVAP